MQEKEEQEKQVLEKIKAKMDRIKATQQKIQGPKYEDDETSHYIGKVAFLFPGTLFFYLEKYVTLSTASLHISEVDPNVTSSLSKSQFSFKR